MPPDSIAIAVWHKSEAPAENSKAYRPADEEGLDCKKINLSIAENGDSLTGTPIERNQKIK